MIVNQKTLVFVGDYWNGSLSYTEEDFRSRWWRDVTTTTWMSVAWELLRDLSRWGWNPI